jgi:hypothetical protein
MSTGTETKVKLSGVLEAMGMALPERTDGAQQAGLSITDTRLPVGFADDEFDDELFMDDGFDGGWPGNEPVLDPFKAAFTEPVEAPVEVPVEIPAARNQGAWAKDHTEVHPLPLHRIGRRSNNRVRTYSVAYYRSEHALATTTFTEGGRTFTEAPSAARRPVDHFDAIGYRGRHRWFKG